MRNFKTLATISVITILFAFCVSAFAEIQFEWDKTIAEGFIPTGLARANDGGYFISAFSRNDNREVEYLALFRTDEEGDTVWTRQLDYIQDENHGLYWPYDNLQRDADENLYLLNVSPSDQQHSISITKFNSDGDSLWRQDYAPEGAEEPTAEFILLRDSGLLLLVSYHFFEGDEPVYEQKLLKLDKDGNITAEYSSRNELGLVEVIENQDGSITALRSSGQFQYFDNELNRTDVVDLNEDYSWSHHLITAPDDCYYVVCESGVGGPGTEVAKYTHDGEQICTTGLFTYSGVLYDYSDQQLFINGNSWMPFLIDKDDLEYHAFHSLGFIVYKFLLDDEGITGVGDGMRLFRISRDQLDVSPTSAPVPNDFSLQNIYPNPFNATTTIGYSLPAAGNVLLAVYDLAGREVARLVNGVKPAGTHEAVWVADGIASGVYVVRLVAGEKTAMSKVVLVK